MMDPDITLTLNKNCDIITTGCATSKGFETANMKYVLTKNKQPMFQGNADICSMVETVPAEVKTTMAMLGLPTSCPIPAGRICPDESKRANISKHKAMLPMAKGKSTAKVFIQHDKGTSCFVATTEIYK